MVTRRDQRGVALIFVLWLLVLLGVIMTEVASRTRAESALLTSLRSRTVARYAAESGILAATVAIERLLDSTHNPLERASVFRQLDARLASLTDVELGGDRKSTRLNSSHSQISYAVFCLKKKKEPK